MSSGRARFRKDVDSFENVSKGEEDGELTVCINDRKFFLLFENPGRYPETTVTIWTDSEDGQNAVENFSKCNASSKTCTIKDAITWLSCLSPESSASEEEDEDEYDNEEQDRICSMPQGCHASVAKKLMVCMRELQPKGYVSYNGNTGRPGFVVGLAVPWQNVIPSALTREAWDVDRDDYIIFRMFYDSLFTELMDVECQSGKSVVAVDSDDRSFVLTWTVRDHMKQVLKRFVSPVDCAQMMIDRTVRGLEQCVVCHAPLSLYGRTIKPFPCPSDFCQFRYVELGLGANPEMELKNSTEVVDMLLSLTYAAAKTGLQYVDPFPRNIRVRLADGTWHGWDHGQPTAKDCELLVRMLEGLPPVQEMKGWCPDLKSRLDEIDRLMYPLLRWVLATNRCYIRPATHRLTSSNNNDNLAKAVQFEICMGDMEKEERFRRAKTAVASKKGLLFGFHGSSYANWHSILRRGLHYEKVVNGRAYGNGVYLSPDLATSRGYSANVNIEWLAKVSKYNYCTGLAELVNCPNQFVSKSPHFVIDKCDWIQLRYLVLGTYVQDSTSQEHRPGSCKAIDSSFPLYDGHKNTVYVPDVQDQDKMDNPVSLSPEKIALSVQTWESVSSSITKSTGTGNRALLNEIKKLYETGGKGDGYEIDLDSIDNLQVWKARLFDFDSSLPLARDLKKLNLDGVYLEIRFENDFPMTPPFVRVVTPRFLPFAEGGGGHVTAGGSICMDLLTSQGWSPAYSIGAVLSQVRVAMCSVDPKPARLVSKGTYTLEEARSAFSRAVKAHNWQ